MRSIVLLILITCIGCSRNEDMTGTNGDWVNNRVVLSITDSVIVFSPTSGRLNPFIETEDKTLIHESETLKISEIDDDSIEVEVSNPDTVIFYRLGAIKKPGSQPKKITKISFSSSGCFGTCPVINFEINEDGTCYYEGIRYTDRTGSYSASGQLNAFQLLEEKIRNLELDKIDSLYAAPWTDDQRVFIKIHYDDKVLKTSVYGNHEEPIALRLLIYYLAGLPDYMDLTPSENKHEFETGYKNLYREAIEFLPPKE